MRSVFQFLAVNAVFVAINAAAVLILFSLFKFGQLVAPDLMENALVTYTLGIAGLALTIWAVWWSIRFINRPSSLKRPA